MVPSAVGCALLARPIATLLFDHGKFRSAAPLTGTVLLWFSVGLVGFATNALFLRDALDKAGIEAQFIARGEYKSAAEPYILDAASPEAKEADLFWLNDIWQRMLADIGKARGIAPATLAANADALPEQVLAARGDLAGGGGGTEHAVAQLGGGGGGGGPAEAARFIRAEAAKWAPILKAGGIRAG